MTAVVRFRYAPTQPPVPVALVDLFHPKGQETLTDLPAIVDSGADQTVVPARFASRLNVPPAAQEFIQGFDGIIQSLPTYLVKLQIKTLTPFLLPIVAAKNVEHIILGRDILNRFVITLDGPNERVEITEVPTP